MKKVAKYLKRAMTVLEAYQVLGVTTSSTAEDIKKKYKELSLKHHPDLGGTHEQMVKINQAKEILDKYHQHETSQERYRYNQTDMFTVRITFRPWYVSIFDADRWFFTIKKEDKTRFIRMIKKVDQFESIKTDNIHFIIEVKIHEKVDSSKLIDFEDRKIEHKKESDKVREQVKDIISKFDKQEYTEIIRGR